MLSVFESMIFVTLVLLGPALVVGVLGIVMPEGRLRCFLGDSFVGIIGILLVLGGIGLSGKVAFFQPNQSGLSTVVGLGAIGFGASLLLRLYWFRMEWRRLRRSIEDRDREMSESRRKVEEKKAEKPEAK